MAVKRPRPNESRITEMEFGDPSASIDPRCRGARAGRPRFMLAKTVYSL